MFLANDVDAVKKVRFWATQARDPAPHYQHSEIGYNYRMSTTKKNKKKFSLYN